jgi:glycosyltransferase involved in cell wall biosynthesis
MNDNASGACCVVPGPRGFAAGDRFGTPRMSVIVPVHNNASDLVQCIAALKPSASADTEIIVVDDASTDDTPAAARTSRVRVVEMSRNSGPGAARNQGAARARGDVLVFVDADVVVAADALDRIRRAFDADPELAAVFGSYDASPRAQGVVSQYRNLLHHFTHQQANSAASTFWAGCGAVRRDVFEALGGFDGSRFDRPSIEDIDLGVRMRRAGLRILLDKQLQATHLKHWNLRSMVATDISRRAVPWSRLILETGRIPDDLNLRRGQRLSAALVGVLCLVLPLIVVWPPAALGAISIVAAVIALNRGLFVFFFQRHGAGFAVACVPLHLLYFLYSALSYLGVWICMKVKVVVPKSTR